MPGLLQPSPERRRQLHQRADVYNLSDDEIVVESPFDGYIHILPRHKYETDIASAALWFGDPIMRNDPREWVAEVQRVKSSRGEDFFQKYILSGKFFCPQINNRDPQFYGHLSPKGLKVAHGKPIAEGELERMASGRALNAQGPLTPLSEDQVISMLAGDTSADVTLPQNRAGSVDIEDRIRNAYQGADDEAGAVHSDIFGDAAGASMFERSGRVA